MTQTLTPLQEREIKSINMLDNGILPIYHYDNQYWVKSQFYDKKYKTSVNKCSCPDNKKGYICKHILLLKKTNNKPKLKPKCLKCSSENIIKKGIQKSKSGNKQKWNCNQCNNYFVINEVSENKANIKIITKCMDLYFKGESYRSIANTLKQFNDLNITQVSVMNWVKKYTLIMDDYLKQFNPVVSDTWHTDEQFIKVKGVQKYIWNCMDNQTKFLLASDVSHKRTTKDAQNLFKNAKITANKKAQTIITDGSFSYSKSVKKEFATRQNKKPHYRYVSFRQKDSNNNIIERYHGTHKDRTKSMRGMKTMKGIQTYNIGFKNYYNFVKPHLSLDGLTPAQVSGLSVNPNWKNIMKNALELK